MSSGIARDTIKALNVALTVPGNLSSLPPDLDQTIAAFLDSNRYHEETELQALHEDLVQLYKHLVANDPEKRRPFLGILNKLKPAIKGQQRLLEWWDLIIRPVVDSIGNQQDEVEEARAFLFSVLIFDRNEDDNGEQAHLSTIFTERLLDVYLSRKQLPVMGSGVVSPMNEMIAHEVESILVIFGRKKTKELLVALDNLFVVKRYRLQALNLLSAFVRVQPPRLYLVLESPLVNHLEACLLNDTSATVVEMALTILIMLLPHIASSLVARLPRLFLIYGRLLCWDRIINENGDLSDEELSSAAYEEIAMTTSWERLDCSLDNADSTTPNLLHYYTFLYGLFPLNFMAFTMKPRTYLDTTSLSYVDGLYLDAEVVRKRSEPFRRVHLLHRNFGLLSVEQELSQNTWLRSDPVDIVMECMGLCVAVTASLEDPGPPPTSKLPPIPNQHVHSNDIPSASLGDFLGQTPVTPLSTLWINDSQTPSSKPPSQKSTDSPTLPPRSEHDVGLNKKSSQSLRSGSIPTAPQSQAPASPRLELFAQNLSRSQASGSPSRVELTSHSNASLQREVMLLRNDLNFERYLKQQHLSFIGQLQQRHISEVTIEAETQNIINANRALKAKLTKSDEMYAQLKRETVTSRNQHKKWNEDLSTKVRSFRDDQKSWRNIGESLRTDLEASQVECDHLKQVVLETEAREAEANMKLQKFELNLAELEALRQEVDQLKSTIQDFHCLQDEFAYADRERRALRIELQHVTEKAKKSDEMMEVSLLAYEEKIQELEYRLQVMAQSNNPPRAHLPPSVQQLMDSAVVASQAKLQQLRRTHTRLLDKYTDLEVRCQEVEAELRLERGYGNRDTVLYGDDTSKSALNRRSSVIGNQLARIGSPRPPPLHTTDRLVSEEEEYYSDYNSAASTAVSGRLAYPGRPVRLQSQQSRKPEEHFNVSKGYSAAYETSLAPTFQASDYPTFTSHNTTPSIDSGESGKAGEAEKDKVQPMPRVRIYGRGGAQNIGHKAKEKPEKKDKNKGSGGFRGLKNIL